MSWDGSFTEVSSGRAMPMRPAGLWRDGTFVQRNAHKVMAEAIDPVKSVGLMKKLETRQ
ncbi:MAG: hypothetical protein HFE94_03495, partial [Acutalibacter sp.]|nr:hypothetical protein [Acutalibacter sp.]